MAMSKPVRKREEEILKKIISILKKHLDPGVIILFGSRAEGRAARGSDFDLAVDRKNAGVSLERKIKEEIDQVAGLYRVDIVYLNSVDLRFRKIILKTGKIIYEK